MKRTIKSAAAALIMAMSVIGSIQASAESPQAADEPHKCVYGTPKQEWYWWNDTRGYIWADISTCTYGCGSQLVTESKTTPTSSSPSERPTNPTRPTYPTYPSYPTSPTTQEYKKGDVNLDGRINAKDATAVLKHIVKLKLLTGKSLEQADVNKDEHVNAKDATEILKIAVGLA